MQRNIVIDLDLAWINSIDIKDAEITSNVAEAKFTDQKTIDEHISQSWLIKAISFIDIALLVGNETPQSIYKLCRQAVFPLEDAEAGDKSKISQLVQDFRIQCAAVCLYPSRIEDAVNSLAVVDIGRHVLIASVAAGFPSGQYPLHTRLGEIYYALATGAQEIDVVIDRSLVLSGLWPQLYDELVQMRKACGEATLKVILSVSECGSWTNVYKASVVAMMAGADFIKTSTGKEAVQMTIHEGFVMCLAIKDFNNRTGIKVGIKPAGGVRTAEQSISWMLMLQEVLGEEWINPRLFRIGTGGNSTLLKSLAEAILSGR